MAPRPKPPLLLLLPLLLAPVYGGADPAALQVTRCGVVRLCACGAVTKHGVVPVRGSTRPHRALLVACIAV
jgi:hypothetical protein